jgi:Icc protein
MPRLGRLWPALFALTLAAAPSDDFRFCILGDRTGEAKPGVYEQAWAEIGREHPDFVITVGDTIQGGSDRTAEAEWRRLRPLWRRFPFYFTPGNHDIWSDTSRRIYEKETGRPAAYSFNYKNAHFTVLDNSGSLELRAKQIEFLTRDLEQNRAREPKFVFFHQPFWLIPLKLQYTGFPFHKLMQKYHVSYVVSGHVHQYDRMEADGVAYLMIGSSGGHLRGHDPAKDFKDGWFYQYLLMTIKSNQIEATVKELDPPNGQGRKFGLPKLG